MMTFMKGKAGLTVRERLRNRLSSAAQCVVISLLAGMAALSISMDAFGEYPSEELDTADWEFTFDKWKVFLRLELWSSNLPDRYCLKAFTLASEGDTPSKTFGISMNEPGSIEIAIEDDVAYFDSPFELYFDEPDKTYSQTERDLGGTPYEPESADRETYKKMAEQAIGVVPIVGQFYSLIQLTEFFQTTPPTLLSSEKPGRDARIGVDSDATIEAWSLPSPNIFANDKAYDILPFGWKRLKDRPLTAPEYDLFLLDSGGGMRFWFTAKNEGNTGMPLLVRVWLPLDAQHPSKSGNDSPYRRTYYAEVEWETGGTRPVTIAWANRQESSGVKDPTYALGPPDMKSAGTSGARFLILKDYSVNIETYRRDDLAEFLKITKDMLDTVDVVAFECNGSKKVPFESSKWTFTDAFGKTLVVNHSYANPGASNAVVHYGNISIADYRAFFNASRGKCTGDMPFLLFDVTSGGLDTTEDGFTVQIECGVGEPASPDPDAIGILK